MSVPPAIRPGTWLRYYRALQDLERARKVAMAPVNEIKERMARVKRAAARDGANMFAMKLLDGVSRLSEGDAQLSIESFVHYLNWAALPVGTQPGLFEQPTKTEVVEHDTWLAEVDGREIALGGGAPIDNPYESDSPLHKVWLKGFKSGVDVREKPPAPALMPNLDDLPAMAPKRGRGRPKGSKGRKTKASTLVGRLRRADREASIAAGL